MIVSMLCQSVWLELMRIAIGCSSSQQRDFRWPIAQTLGNGRNVSCGVIAQACGHAGNRGRSRFELVLFWRSRKQALAVLPSNFEYSSTAIINMWSRFGFRKRRNVINPEIASTHALHTHAEPNTDRKSKYGVILTAKRVSNRSLPSTQHAATSVVAQQPHAKLCGRRIRRLR